MGPSEIEYYRKPWGYRKRSTIENRRADRCATHLAQTKTVKQTRSIHINPIMQMWCVGMHAFEISSHAFQVSSVNSATSQQEARLRDAGGHQQMPLA